MQAGKRYSLYHSVRWTRNSTMLFLGYSTIPPLMYFSFGLDLSVPWQPLSLIGIAVAFYLGFKNNASYERTWEARKIWGGIVNVSRSFTVMARDFVTNEHAHTKLTPEELRKVHQRIVHRHTAWLHALTYQLRKLQPWEHGGEADNAYRERLGTTYTKALFERLQKYLSDQEFDYMMSKDNHASHLLSLQSAEFKSLKMSGLIEDFRHIELQSMITEMYALQGKSERIKNFPFPRQYASANLFFVVLFLLLLPFGMFSVFFNPAPESLKYWLTIPFATLASWVFWFMESIGEYSENPFEGLFNDVPITQMAHAIELDISQMLEENENLPQAVTPNTDMQILT